MADLSSLPDDFLFYSDDRFYDFVANSVGEIEMDILRIQCIGNVRTTLHVPDVFDFFRLNCEETADLKAKACFITDDGIAVVRRGIRSNMEHFISLLRTHYSLPSINGDSSSPAGAFTQLSYDSRYHSLNFVARSNSSNQKNSSTSFSHVFVDNLMQNMNRSSNNYQYDPLVEKFASALHIMAGNNAYEFIRMNLPGSSPSPTTLKQYARNMNMSLIESEFRFLPLKDYLLSIDSKFVFVVNFWST